MDEFPVAAQKSVKLVSVKPHAAVSMTTGGLVPMFPTFHAEFIRRSQARKKAYESHLNERCEAQDVPEKYRSIDDSWEGG